MDYFLNLKTENKLMFSISLIRFFFGIAYVDPSKADIIAAFNKEPDEKKAPILHGGDELQNIYIF
jgi:hypothetical protein